MIRIASHWPSTFEFACHSAACAPPPAGTGGSRGSGGGGGRSSGAGAKKDGSGGGSVQFGPKKNIGGGYMGGDLERVATHKFKGTTVETVERTQSNPRKGRGVTKFMRVIHRRGWEIDLTGHHDPAAVAQAAHKSTARNNSEFARQMDALFS